MVGQRTPYCENFEHPCDNEHDVVNAKTGLCPNKKRAKCMPLQHFACETYVVSVYGVASRQCVREYQSRISIENINRISIVLPSIYGITHSYHKRSTSKINTRIQVRKRDQGICTDFEKTKTIEQSVGH